MATPKPTQKPVPSSDIRDLPFNSEKMDEFTNSEGYTYVDRLGRNRRTLAGIDNDASQAMLNYGYITKDSFETGNTLLTPNTVLRWRFNGEFYRWDGDWSGPKVVPAGSTPMSTGGIEKGKWLSVGDASTRAELVNYELSRFSRAGSLAAGGDAVSVNSVFKATDGLWWIYTGPLPRVILPNTNPEADPLWYCVGLLNSIEINLLSAWCDTTSLNDRTRVLRLFFRTLGYLGLKAIGSGSVMVSSSVSAGDVEFDFGDLTVHIDPESTDSVSGGAGCILHIIDPGTKVYKNQPFATSNVGQITTVQLSGSAFRNCSVGILAETDMDNAYLRYGTLYTKKSDIYLMDDSGLGFHGATPALFKYNGPVQLTVRPVRNSHIYKAPTFVMSAPLSRGRRLRTGIRVERNNVTIVGGNLNAQAKDMFVESLYEGVFVTDFEVIAVKMLNQNNNSSELGNYVVNCYGVLNPKVSNSRILNGWALLDGNFMRNTVVMDSEAPSVGCHAMAWNFHVERCKMFATLVNGEYQGGVAVTGGGKLTVKDCEYIYRGGPRAKDHPVSTRGDYGQGWEGDINIDDMEVTLDAPTPVGQALAVLFLQGANIGSVDMTRDCFLGKTVSIKGTKVKAMDASWPVERVVVNPCYFQTTYTQRVHFPSKYIIEDFKLETTGPGWTLDPRWPVLETHENAVSKTIECVMRRVQGSHAENLFVIQATEELIAIGAYKTKVEILLEDFQGPVRGTFRAPKGYKLTTRRCVINRLAVGGIANSESDVRIDQNEINGRTCGGSVGKDVIYFYNNHITSDLPVAIGSLAKYCNGNTVVSTGSITGRTVSEWWSYRDPALFRIS